MAIPYVSLNQAGFKAPDPKRPKTPLEAYLTKTHGNLHGVIPVLMNKPGASQATVAQALSTAEVSVSRAWVGAWLRDNGYRKLIRWERK